MTHTLTSPKPDARIGIAVLDDGDVAKIESKADLDGLRVTGKDAGNLEDGLASTEMETIERGSGARSAESRPGPRSIS